MQIEYSSRDLGNGVTVSLISDPKFKTNLINVHFLCEWSRENAAAFSLIPQILSSTNHYYPDSSLMSRRLNALYGAWLGGSSRFRGGIYDMSVSVTSLRDRFALDGDRVFEDSAKLLLDCIFDPATEDGGFLRTEFNTKKLNLLSFIDGEINDKPTYAMIEAFKNAYRGEFSAERHFGSREEVEELTAVRAYEVYKSVLKDAKIDITFCGGGDFDSALALFERAFSAPRCCWQNPSYYYLSPAKPKPEYRCLQLEVQQASMILIFKTAHPDSAAMEVMSSLYGETPFSKLFLNVRERLSLCYYCTSVYGESKGVLSVESGVDPANVVAAKDEILRQLELIQSGDFTDEELADTKLAIRNSYRGIYDRIGRLSDWYYNRRLRGDSDSPDERLVRIERVTREDIIAAAKSLSLDTAFVLTDRSEKGVWN